MSDLDVQAANALNAIFGRMEVPCEVQVNEAEGKHVKATNDINAGEVLFDEVPMACWPSPLFATAPSSSNHGDDENDAATHTGVLCFVCLRRREVPSTVMMNGEEEKDTAEIKKTSPRERADEEEEAEEEEEEEEEEELFWLQCDDCKVYTCSDACRESWSASSLHALLCGPARERLNQAEREMAPRSRAEQEEQMLQGITLEALARCAAWLVSRLGQTLRQAQLPVSAFIPSSSPGGSEEDISALQHQIFSVASAPFNRLLAAPDNTEYKGINVFMWKKAVREALQRTAPDFLNSCVISDEEGEEDGDDEEEEQKGEEKEEKAENEGAQASSGIHDDRTWCAALLEAALSDDTLQTMLGQLALNSHAINTVLLSPNEQKKAGVPDFRVVVKGAGLYSLLSNFNHSCEPNLAVSHPRGNHELEVKAIRDIAEGEPLTISYIPLEDSNSAVSDADKENMMPEKKRKERLRDALRERRRELKQYFFECHCTRCVREEELLRV